MLNVFRGIFCPPQLIVCLAGLQNPQMPQVEVQRFAMLVTAHIPPDRLAGSSLAQQQEAQDKLVGCVCGDILRMETEQSAIAYMEFVKQNLRRSCSTILCADNGAMVSSSGIVGGGASHRAPVLTPQQPCYGQLPREQTPEFCFWGTATWLLQQITQLQPDLVQAQVHSAWLTLH